MLKFVFTKPHCYGVFTYTVIEDNLYDSVFLMLATYTHAIIENSYAFITYYLF